MPVILRLACLLLVVCGAGWWQVLSAQQAVLDRLPVSRFDVTPPSLRVSGTPGTIAVRQTDCRALPLSAVRRRVVDVAVQEWAFFGFPVVERARLEQVEQDDDPESRPRRRPRLPEAEAERIAPSIAGYWTATSSAAWILDRQNEEWNGPDGIGARWQYPWSAAFISWVMCEGGLASPAQFQRAVAHHTYIDQAIRARRTGDAAAAFVAYEVGEALVEPGDLLCSARRPAYRTMAERQGRMGEGARTHCDVVVRVDATREQVLAIGGNVGARVSLKVLPATRTADGVRPRAVSLGRRGLSAFAHLKLRAPSIGAEAIDVSPTVRALACGSARAAAPLARVGIVPRPGGACTE